MFHTSEALGAVVAAALGASAFPVACALHEGGAGNVRGAHVVISVAPLEVPDVTSARYTVVVTNQAGYTVWSRTVDSADYGRGAGALEYLGPCDPELPRHHVSVAVEALYAGPARRADWRAPTLAVREVLCRPNETVRAEFDLDIPSQARLDGVDPRAAGAGSGVRRAHD
ncbi:MAG: hypothetical protein KC635_20170 [Myxococcales bacterium]|nr:hypothetical protein [Myxococcales bacterium]MCB9735067.1 hypothetical protein [Deltaproteobacteria bacterium]